MRILVAPDCFGGTLSAVEVAAAVRAGWASVRPADELVLAPLSDGGPGLVDVLHAALGGELCVVTVEDPLARPVQATFLLHEGTAYVESAQACGLHLLSEGERDPMFTTTYGVGQLVLTALDAGASRVVVGLGGSGTNDGGAGLLAALGVARLDGAGERLAPGGAALRALGSLRGVPDPRLVEVDLVAATDVDAPLLGLFGASSQFAPQKGASRDDVQVLDQALERWADALEAHLGVAVRDLPGAGAAGGLGAALLALGARREPGIALVRTLVDLDRRAAGADLVITGEGRFDATSLRGKVVSGVAAVAAENGLPCVVLAGQVEVGRREAAAIGVDAAYSLAEEVGLPTALTAAAASLEALAARVARQWSRDV